MASGVCWEGIPDYSGGYVMDTKTFESIKTKVDTLKQRRAKAEGAIESIEGDWLKNYKTKNIKELEAKLAEMEEDVEADTADRDKVFEELKGLHTWQFV